ncbi:phospholipase B1, membrane-associated-like [Oscarella lobularis]|uniref:phospholipase B1, membrane-associated-like n=1 Tax=Oscarella lobularis TaxID=121494 RepID=UPI003313C930
MSAKFCVALLCLNLACLVVSFHGKISGVRQDILRRAFKWEIFRGNLSVDASPGEVFQRVAKNVRRLSTRPIDIKSGSLLPVGVAEFDCERPYTQTLSTEAPTSVHRLRPGDVSVVGSIGDSVTAGFWAKTDKDINEMLAFEEHVDVSWSIGGNGTGPTDCATLSNFLRYYNPNLIGYSTGVCSTSNPSGSDACPNGNMNAAVSGSKSRDILPQAERLVTLMQNDQNIDFANDWKVVTLFIGGNDLCKYCIMDPPGWGITPAEYRHNVEITLDYLKDNMPRTFVNLVNVVDITLLDSMRDLSNCDLFYQAFCQCLDAQDQMLQMYVQEYQNGLRNLVEEAKYDQNDFTVVLQPFFEEMTLPSDDPLQFFAPDCFHFGVRGHAAVGVSLWNNMFEAVGAKSTHPAYDLDVSCPQWPFYLRTRRNSPLLNEKERPQS